MADVHTPEQRSRNMAAIKATDTKPELRVRSLLHSLGFRFRLHKKDMPGKPDIVLPKYRTAIFVHGCFWHCHECRWGSVVPKTRPEFWARKRQGTRERDARNIAALKEIGWKVLVIWECESRIDKELQCRLRSIPVKPLPVQKIAKHPINTGDKSFQNLA
jgi:DNA mismatch endonuclease (patch repair protein)